MTGGGQLDRARLAGPGGAWSQLPELTRGYGSAAGREGRTKAVSHGRHPGSQTWASCTSRLANARPDGPGCRAESAYQLE